MIATLEEQQAAQQLLDQAVATAKQNINAADTNQEVAQAKRSGHTKYSCDSTGNTS
ncbi:LPXTG surface protein [Staphylococcus aureus]|uniref:LPXTG surface protein n=1 Tax=Staphylococcus aureus TaxID=1280 RepID=A0A380E5A1_STAAU|nr:LPXTG surface protein [Staphylococcus aureus]